MHRSCFSHPRPGIRPALAVLAALLLGSTASAQTGPLQLRAGLWENSFTLKTADGRLEAAMKEMHAQLASLPPEQRKAMADMMARQGVGLGTQASSVRVCMTQAEVERAEPPPANDGCSQQGRRSGNVWQLSFKCAGPPPSSGEGRLVLQSPTAYQGEFSIVMVEDGKPMDVRMTQSGRWLGADCGAVRPTDGRSQRP